MTKGQFMHEVQFMPKAIHAPKAPNDLPLRGMICGRCPHDFSRSALHDLNGNAVH